MEFHQGAMKRNKYYKRNRYYGTNKLCIHQTVDQRRQEMKRRNKKYSATDKE